ncbi:unnamed protein product, partial [Allacma fusca]
ESSSHSPGSQTRWKVAAASAGTVIAVMQYLK